jgi:serine/threonine protein kinase
MFVLPWIFFFPKPEPQPQPKPQPHNISTLRLQHHCHNPHRVVVAHLNSSPTNSIPEHPLRKSKPVNHRVHLASFIQPPNGPANDILEQAFDGFAIDLWAAAIVLFILLVGNPPKIHPCDSIRYELIAKQDQLVPLLQSWQRFVSPQAAADLLQRMLREDPNERLSLQEVQEHPWVRNNHVVVPAINEK